MNRRGFVKQVVAAVGGLLAWFTHAKPVEAASAGGKICIGPGIYCRSNEYGAFEVEHYLRDGIHQTQLHCRGSKGYKFDSEMVAHIQEQVASIMAEAEKGEDIRIVWDWLSNGGCKISVSILPQHLRI